MAEHEKTERADAALAGLAAKQWGVVEWDEVTALGVTEDRRRWLVHTGLLVPMHHRVYRFRAAPECFEQRLIAAVKFNGADAVASHRAAARLWNLPGFGTAPVEVSKPRGRSQRRAYGWVHGSLRLPPNHVTRTAGIPVTTPARTVFDLAGIVHPKRAERALDNALARKTCTFAQLEAVFSSLARRGRRGTTVMRALLETRGDGYVAPSSELEALGRRLLRDAGLPEPEFEVNLGNADSWLGRVDILYRDAGLVIELDGRRYHTAPLDMVADTARANSITATGLRIMRYSWWDLTQAPTRFVSEVRAARSAEHLDPFQPNSSQLSA